MPARPEECHDRRRVARGLAIDPADHRLRLPDRDARLRPAFDARLLPDADVDRQRLGPRRVRARDCDPDAALGRGAAVRRRRSPTASVRCSCCASAPCSTPSGFAWMTYATHAGRDVSLRRRDDRLRACRFVLHRRDRSVRQAAAAGMAIVFVRGRHRGEFVRAIPVLAAGGGAQFRASTGTRRC